MEASLQQQPLFRECGERHVVAQRRPRPRQVDRRCANTQFDSVCLLTRIAEMLTVLPMILSKLNLRERGRASLVRTCT
jgi:hypothetical protein